MEVAQQHRGYSRRHILMIWMVRKSTGILDRKKKIDNLTQCLEAKNCVILRIGY